MYDRTTDVGIKEVLGLTNKVSKAISIFTYLRVTIKILAKLAANIEDLL